MPLLRHPSRQGTGGGGVEWHGLFDLLEQDTAVGVVAAIGLGPNADMYSAGHQP